MQGKIIKGVGGFYYIHLHDNRIFECKAKGKFRKDKISPLTGDRVTITVREDKENTIDEIHERKNKLIRPPVANIDKLMIVVSAAKPVPNYLVIDKMTVLAEKNNIEPVIIITKTDLTDYKELYDTYRSTGYKVLLYSDVDNRSMLNEIKKELNGHLTAFTGNSGVGKSTMLNHICPEISLETGEINQKLGRGRHTTRLVEILKADENTWISDTPGFSAFDVTAQSEINAENLAEYFLEFREFGKDCRFVGCAHIKEDGCAVLRALEEGKIQRSRYESYKKMYLELSALPKYK